MDLRSFRLSFLLLLLLVFGPLVGNEVISSPPPQNIIVKLQTATNNLHSTFMAVKLARLLAKKKQNVTLFVNIEGVRIVDKRQPLSLRWGPGSEELGKVYKGFVKNGGKVLVCPHCAKAAGVRKRDLRKGAVLGTEESIAKALIDADKILDY